jgi:hypothetical protein
MMRKQYMFTTVDDDQIEITQYKAGWSVWLEIFCSELQDGESTLVELTKSQAKELGEKLIELGERSDD